MDSYMMNNSAPAAVVAAFAHQVEMAKGESVLAAA